VAALHTGEACPAMAVSSGVSSSMFQTFSRLAPVLHQREAGKRVNFVCIRDLLFAEIVGNVENGLLSEALLQAYGPDGQTNARELLLAAAAQPFEQTARIEGMKLTPGFGRQLLTLSTTHLSEADSAKLLESHLLSRHNAVNVASSVMLATFERGVHLPHCMAMAAFLKENASRPQLLRFSRARLQVNNTAMLSGRWRKIASKSSSVWNPQDILAMIR